MPMVLFHLVARHTVCEICGSEVDHAHELWGYSPAHHGGWGPTMPSSPTAAAGPCNAHGPLQAQPHGSTWHDLRPKGYMWHMEPAQPTGMHIHTPPGQFLPSPRAPSIAGRSHTPSGLPALQEGAVIPPSRQELA